MNPFLFVILLTFTVPIEVGVTVEQKVVFCRSTDCVDVVRNQAMDSPAISRVRVWSYDDYSPLSGLRSFVFPPLNDWQKD